MAATPLGAAPSALRRACAADSLDAEVDYDFDSKTTPRRAPGAVGAGPGAAAAAGRPAYPAAARWRRRGPPRAPGRLGARRADPGRAGARAASGPAAASARPRPDGFPPSDRALGSPRGGSAGVARHPRAAAAAAPARGRRAAARARPARAELAGSGGGCGPPGSGGRAGRGRAPAGDKVLLGGADCTLGDKPSSLRKVVSASLRCALCAQAAWLPGAAWQPDVRVHALPRGAPDLRKLSAITLRAPASAACTPVRGDGRGVEDVAAAARIRLGNRE